MSDQFAYSPREEQANSLSHALGLGLSVAGLALLVIFAARRGDAWVLVSTALFGATLVLLYAASTLYHAARSDRHKIRLRRLDHAAIFLLIAGTYTPFLLISLRGPWGWSLFGVIWGLALLGTLMKVWWTGRFRGLSTALYIAMGWIVVIAANPLLEHVPRGSLGLLLAGGLCYTGGTVFYLWRRLPYHHAIWHLWVLAGSACHWAAVFFFLIPPAV
jgi:hemolysin III